MGQTKGGSSRQTRSEKGKGIAEENPDSGSHVPQLRKAKPLMEKKKKQSARSRTVREKPSSAELMRILKKDVEIVQTKWADENILHELHILEDVTKIFGNMGLRTLLRTEFHTYTNPTAQFLATLELYDDTSMDPSDPERAHITFKVNSVSYSLTLNEIASVMGFEFGGETGSLTPNKFEAESVWETISAGQYKIGASKATSIRHPAIRYAHTFLAHTLFGRRETGYVKEEELALLIEGIKPHLVTCSNDCVITGQEKRLNLSRFLVNRFLWYQNWIHTFKDKSPQICIGGLITPILESVGVDLGPSEWELERLDAAYLTRANFLTGRVRTGYIYRFLNAPGDYRKIILPRRAMTRITTQENIKFQPREIHWYNPVKDGQASAIPRYSTGQASADQPEPEAEPEAETEAEHSPELYGSRRYHFDPYNEPISGPALREAHRQNGLLQRWCKWNDKQRRKMKKTIKDMKKQIKDLTKAVMGGRSNREEEREEETEDEAAERGERHSFSGTASASLVVHEPGMSSYHGERPSTGKRKATRSPSTSGSGNRSTSMDTSSSC